MTGSESPAATIRRAASLMRERAEAAAEGPWHPVAGIWGDEIATAVIARDGDPSDPHTWLLATGFGDAPQQKATAEHAASWHPLVALAVAVWLDIEATIAERGMPDESGSIHPALVVARAYLGEPVTP
jgi:hypothetical protein